MMGKLEVVKNVIKNSGVSLPPVLIIAVWVVSSVLLYPHQPAKEPVHTKIANKKTVNKISTKFPSQKNKINITAISYSLQKPTPNIVQIAPTVTPTLIIPTTLPTVTLTQVPVPTASPVNVNGLKQSGPTPTSAPNSIQNNQTENTQTQNTSALGGVSKIVNQIVPTAVSLLNANPLLSK